MFLDNLGIAKLVDNCRKLSENVGKCRKMSENVEGGPGGGDLIKQFTSSQRGIFKYSSRQPNSMLTIS